MVAEHPAPSVITYFQTPLYSSRCDEILTAQQMSAMELANVCVNRWLSDDHILWLMENLNKSQTDTYCLFLNGSINKDPKTLRRFSRGDALPTKLLFAINVARPSAGETQFGTDERPGCHWTMCYIHTIGKKITYGDSLAWQYPSNLLEKVNQYIKAVSSDDDVTNYSIFLLS